MFRRRRRALLVGCALLAALLLGPSAWIRVATAGGVHDSPAGLRPEPVAVIFGAEVLGTAPSHMLAARLNAGIDLYRRGLVRSLLVTGANGASDREVDVMVRVLAAAGIPASAIRADTRGLNTATSCERAVQVYGIRRAILVTQAFHAPRALYTCRSVGLDGSALGVPDWGREGTSMMVRMTLREILASVRAIVL